MFYTSSSVSSSRSMFDAKRRVRYVVVGLTSLCCRPSTGRCSAGDSMRSFGVPTGNRSWTDSPSKTRPSAKNLSSTRCSPVCRRRFLVVGLFIILVTGFLLSNGGDWSLDDDDTMSYFRLHSPPRSPADLARLLRQSVVDSRGTWQCAGDGTSGRNDTRVVSGSCRPMKSVLAAVSAAHPTVYSTTGISCKAMFHGDKAEIQAARRYMEIHPNGSASNRKLALNSFLNGTDDCADFRRKRGYFDEPLSQAEAEFPIAYSILMYDNVPQVERLLRAIYVPQNFYCIHVDIKAEQTTKDSIAAMAKCFDNVFIASQLESVYWGHISIIYAEMNCLRDLLRFQWKYFINLSGFMFPAHSNGDLVNILKLYDGANDIEGSYKRSDHFWMKARNALHWHLSKTLGISLLTLIPKTSAPYNVTIYKGSNQAALTREFVVYFMNSAASLNLIKWFTDTLAPDEYIWPTLNHNPQLHAPGSYIGDPETKTFTARATIWQPIADQINWSWSPWPCYGQWVREICIFGVGDLPWLHRRPELFVNKFYADFEPLAYDCMEELIFNRTVRSFRHPTSRGATVARSDNSDEAYDFDPTYYLRLPFVANKSTTVVSLGETLEFLGEAT